MSDRLSGMQVGGQQEEAIMEAGRGGPGCLSLSPIFQFLALWVASFLLCQ